MRVACNWIGTIRENCYADTRTLTQLHITTNILFICTVSLFGVLKHGRCICYNKSISFIFYVKSTCNGIELFLHANLLRFCLFRTHANSHTHIAVITSFLFGEFKLCERWLASKAATECKLNFGYWRNWIEISLSRFDWFTMFTFRFIDGCQLIHSIRYEYLLNAELKYRIKRVNYV